MNRNCTSFECHELEITNPSSVQFIKFTTDEMKQKITRTIAMVNNTNELSSFVIQDIFILHHTIMVITHGMNKEPS